MKSFARNLLAIRLMTLLMCLVLVITGVGSVAAMQHSGHQSGPSAATAAVATNHAVHASHRSVADSDEECCQPDGAAASGCHASACCFSELQYSGGLTPMDLGLSTCSQPMLKLLGPSIATPLLERPPIFS